MPLRTAPQVYKVLCSSQLLCNLTDLCMPVQDLCKACILIDLCMPVRNLQEACILTDLCMLMQDLKEAKAQYSQLVQRLISNGTTTAVMFGSLHLEPTMLLADTLHQVRELC